MRSALDGGSATARWRHSGACMQGNCTAAPPARLVGPDAAPHTPPQCAMRVAHTTLHVSLRNASIWLHGLHLHAAPNAPSAPAYALLELSGWRSQAWLTAMTFSASGGRVRGMFVESTRTYIGGATLCFAWALHARCTALYTDRSRAHHPVPAGVSDRANIHHGQKCACRKRVPGPAR